MNRQNFNSVFQTGYDVVLFCSIYEAFTDADIRNIFLDVTVDFEYILKGKS